MSALRRMSLGTGLLALALACACDVAPEGDAEAPVEGAEEAAPPPPGDVVPGEPAELRGWLQAFAYRTWEAQSEVRPTGEHGGARIFFNPELAASMRAGAREHPPGAAAVRELYASDLTTLRGFALMLKRGPSGPEGEGWFWYEIFGTAAEARPTISATGAPGCVGCHAGGEDFVHRPAGR